MSVEVKVGSGGGGGAPALHEAQRHDADLIDPSRYGNAFLVPNFASPTDTAVAAEESSGSGIGDGNDHVTSTKPFFVNFDVGELEPTFRELATFAPNFPPNLPPAAWPDDPQWDARHQLPSSSSSSSHAPLSSRDHPEEAGEGALSSESSFYHDSNQSASSSSATARTYSSGARQVSKTRKLPQLPPYLISPYYLPSFPSSSSTRQTPSQTLRSQMSPLTFHNPRSVPSSPASPPADPYSISHVLPPLRLPPHGRAVPSVYYVHDELASPTSAPLKSKSRSRSNSNPEKSRSDRSKQKERRRKKKRPAAVHERSHLKPKSRENQMRMYDHGGAAGVGSLDDAEDEAKHGLPEDFVRNRQRPRERPPFSALHRAPGVESDNDFSGSGNGYISSDSDYSSSPEGDDVSHLLEDRENVGPLPARVPVSRSGKARVSKGKPVAMKYTRQEVLQIVENELSKEEDEHYLEEIDDLTTMAVPSPSVVLANEGFMEPGLFDTDERVSRSPGAHVVIQKRHERRNTT